MNSGHMQKLVFLLLIFLSINAFCQPLSFNADDSLIRTCRVKQRTISYSPLKSKGSNEWRQLVGSTDYFDRNGRFIKSESVTDFGTVLVTTNAYYDSSGKKYASVEKMNVGLSSTKGDSLQTHANQERITYFEYDQQQRLVRSFLKYSGSQAIHSEMITSYDPLTRKFSIYTNEGYLYSTRTTFYGQGLVPIKSVNEEFDSSGNAVLRVTHSYKNTFDAAGRLQETICEDDPTLNAQYRYYKNGLTRARKGHKTSYSWRMKYKYYK